MKKVVMTTIIFILFSCIFAVLLPTGICKTTENEWNKTFGGTGEDLASSIRQTSDEGFIIVGSTGSYKNSIDNDVWLIKTDTNGTEKWNKTFGEYKTEDTYFHMFSNWGNAVEQTDDGGYFVVGNTLNSHGTDDIWLIKTDFNGTEEWNKTIAGGRASSMHKTEDKGYFIVGETRAYRADNYCDVWLIKVDSYGNEQWNKTIGQTNGEIVYSNRGYYVIQTNDGGYLVVAVKEKMYYDGTVDNDVWLIKTDINGTQEWNKTFGGTDQDEGYSVQQTNDGGYVIAGDTASYGAGYFDVWLIKTDANGNEEWNKTFGGGKGANGRCVRQTFDGGYIIVGRIAFGDDINAVWLIKTDANGTKEWDKTFAGGADFNEWADVIQTIDGSYIIVSNTRSHGAGGEDIWLIKTYGGKIADNKGRGTPGFELIFIFCAIALISLFKRKRIN